MGKMAGVRLFHKLFGGFVLAALLLIAFLIVAFELVTARSSERFFAGQELAHIHELSAEIADVYGEFEGFDVYRKYPRFWYRTVAAGHVLRDPTACRDKDEPLCDQPNAGNLASLQHRSPLEAAEEMRTIGSPPDPMYLGPRTALYDLERNPIAGVVYGNDKQLYPITAGGKQVGWLGVTPLLPVAEADDALFAMRQWKTLLAAGAAGLVIAMLFAWISASWLTKPILTLSQATRRLTQRDFTGTISLDRNDELGQLAEDLANLSSQIAAYNENQRRWIGDIAHELRTPLAILSAEVEALLDGVREPTMEQLASIGETVAQLTSLVEDLHALSIAESGSLQLNLEPQDLLVFVLQFADTLTPLLGEEELTLRIANQTVHERTMVMADKKRLRQVFTNLLSNTLRYVTKPGWVEIALRDDGAFTALSITDSGPGVPPETVPLLFDRLFRVDNSRNRSRGGSGLGLAIVRSIVEAHGGTIRAENIDHAGLRITIRLPRMAAGALV